MGGRKNLGQIRAFAYSVLKYDCMSKKKEILAELYADCLKSGNMEFDNDKVKSICTKFKFANPFDVTKIDSSNGLPQSMKDDDVFIVHLGGERRSGRAAKHKFINGIDIGYHKFEKIISSSKKWPYSEKIIDNMNSSESNSLFLAYNHKIINDFLYEDITAAPSVYGSHRTSVKNLEYFVGNQAIRTGGSLQTEFDLTLEYRSTVSIFEAKNGMPEDFNVFQIFIPFRYYLEKRFESEDEGIGIVECCYMLRDGDTLNFYLYTFEEEDYPESIILLKSDKYELEKK